MIKDKKIVNSAKSGDKTAYNTLSDKGFDQALMLRYEENDSFLTKAGMLYPTWTQLDISFFKCNIDCV